MSTKSKISRDQQQTADQKLIDGLKKHEPTIASLVIGGTALKTSDIIGILQARIAARNAAVTTRAIWQSDVKADHDERAKTKTLVSGLRQALQVAFVGSIDALADFGLKPRKPRVLTPEQKQAAAAKAKATRAARHTMGSKQRALIKGTAPEAVPATPPSPATTTTTTASSPAAPKPAEPPATGPSPVGTSHSS